LTDDLALAYLYTYAFRNAGKVASELNEAERRGFRPGPREFEQQADAYVFRAEYEIRQASARPPDPRPKSIAN